jgi:hypothetical protein
MENQCFTPVPRLSPKEAVMQWLSGSRPSAMWQARLVELWWVGKRSGLSVSKDC